MEPSHKNRLKHVEHGHGVDLVAPNNMHHHHEIGHSDEPFGAVRVDDDVVSDLVAVGPVADDGHREVAERHHNVGKDDASPHGDLRGPLLGGRNSGLNF